MSWGGGSDAAAVDGPLLGVLCCLREAELAEQPCSSHREQDPRTCKIVVELWEIMIFDFVILHVVKMVIFYPSVRCRFPVDWEAYQ